MAQAQMQQAKTSEQTMPPAGVQEQSNPVKKNKWLMWLIIAIVIIGLGLGAYFWLI